MQKVQKKSTLTLQTALPQKNSCAFAVYGPQGAELNWIGIVETVSWNNHKQWGIKKEKKKTPKHIFKKPKLEL